MSELRKEWKDAKTKASKAGLDMAHVADKQKLGDHLDKFEEKQKLYEVVSKKGQLKPDQKKEDAAATAYKDAAKAALRIAVGYVASLKSVIAGTTGKTKVTATELHDALMDIVADLTKVAKGDFS